MNVIYVVAMGAVNVALEEAVNVAALMDKRGIV
jgi:hypothetical protein